MINVQENLAEDQKFQKTWKYLAFICVSFFIIEKKTYLNRIKQTLHKYLKKVAFN